MQVRKGTLEVGCCPSGDHVEVNENLETNKNLNGYNPPDEDRLDKDNSSEGDGLMDGNSTRKEDVALDSWNDKKNGERVCSKRHHILKI